MENPPSQDSVPCGGAPPAQGEGLRLVGAARGDPHSPFTASGAARFLFDALARRFQMVDRVDVSLRPVERALVAAASFHPSRDLWRARFYRSHLAFALQSRNSRRALQAVAQPFDLVVQIFGLFQTLGSPYVVYADNTHEITRRLWPEWSPFGPREVERWYARERLTYLQAEHLFVTGRSVAESLVSFYGVAEERVTVVVGGVNFEQLPERREAGPREPVILFVGRTYAGGRLKGLDCLLDAFRAVRPRFPDARLQIVGTDEVPPEPGVEVLGPVNDRARIADLYARAAIFCLPSRFEAYGGSSTCEAMAYGLPCLVTTVGGFPEVVVDGETGLLVPPGDPEALADALARLLSEPAWAAQLGAAGRRRVEEYLNWDKVVERMVPALDRIAPRESGAIAG